MKFRSSRLINSSFGGWQSLEKGFGVGTLLTLDNSGQDLDGCGGRVVGLGPRSVEVFFSVSRLGQPPHRSALAKSPQSSLQK